MTERSNIMSTQQPVPATHPAPQQSGVGNSGFDHKTAAWGDALESEYRRGYRHGYEQRDAEVRGAMA